MSIQGPLFILLGALCFSTIGTAQALAPAEATPYAIGAFRMLGGGLFLLLWCWFKNNLPKLQGWFGLNYICCVFGLISFQVCFFSSLKLVGVAVGTVVAIGFTPVSVGILSWLLLKERPTRVWYVATVLAVLGLGLLASTGELSFNFVGILLALIGGGSYGLYLVSVKKLLNQYNATVVTMVLMLSAGIVMLPILFIEPVQWVLTVPGSAMVIHLGLVTIAMAFTLTMKGLQTTPVTIGSTLGLAEPMGAALLGIFFLKEPYTGWSILGMALILLAVLVLVIPMPKPKFLKSV